MLILQVETVGDKYMAVSGLPTRCTNHTANIANLALDMIDIVQEVNARGRKMQVIVCLKKSADAIMLTWNWGCSKCDYFYFS